MERELFQETLLQGFGDREAPVTSILGFFRWLERGGKPEFVGVTRLRTAKHQIFPDEREVYRIRDPKKGMPLKNFFYVPTQTQLRREIENIFEYEKRGSALSLSLKVALILLYDADTEWVQQHVYGLATTSDIAPQK